MALTEAQRQTQPGVTHFHSFNDYYVWVDGWMDEWMVGWWWTDGWVDGRIDEWMDGWVGWWIGGEVWMDGGCMDS